MFKKILFSHFLFCIPFVLLSQVIDFEHDSKTCQEVDNAYYEQNYGVSFYTFTLNCNPPVFGYSRNNDVEGFYPDDTVDPNKTNLDFGYYFITDPDCKVERGHIPDAFFIKVHNPSCRSAEGFILDVDELEAWTISAYGQYGCEPVQSVTVCSNAYYQRHQDECNCDIVQKQGDKAATHWSLQIPPGPSIDYVSIAFTGDLEENNGVGFGFDNFLFCGDDSDYDKYITKEEEGEPCYLVACDIKEEDPINAFDFEISPNPSSKGKVVINFDQPLPANSEMTILDKSGQVWYQAKIDKKSMSVDLTNKVSISQVLFVRVTNTEFTHVKQLIIH